MSRSRFALNLRGFLSLLLALGVTAGWGFAPMPAGAAAVAEADGRLTITFRGASAGTAGVDWSVGARQSAIAISLAAGTGSAAMIGDGFPGGSSSMVADVAFFISGTGTASAALPAGDGFANLAGLNGFVLDIRHFSQTLSAPIGFFFDYAWSAAVGVVPGEPREFAQADALVLLEPADGPALIDAAIGVGSDGGPLTDATSGTGSFSVTVGQFLSTVARGSLLVTVAAQASAPTPGTVLLLAAGLVGLWLRREVGVGSRSLHR